MTTSAKTTNSINEALLSWINDHGAQGIITTDHQLRICGWNAWMEIHSGKKAEVVHGQKLFELFPELVERSLDRYYKLALEGCSDVLNHNLHRYLLEMPVSEVDRSERMYQSVRISPLLEDGKIVGTVTVIEDVTKRVRREAELQRLLEERALLLAGESAARNAAETANKRLAQLQIVTDAAATEMSLDALLNYSTNAVRQIFNCDIAAILTAEPEGDFSLGATAGLNMEMSMRVPASDEFLATIAKKLRPQTIKTPFPGGPFTDAIADIGINSLSGVPLRADKRLLGILCVGTREPNLISDDNLRFMTLVGDRIAVSVERLRLYEDERRARALAEEANRLKDQFLATVSHELRTPLNAILGWARMLMSGRIDERTSRHAIQVIERNARAQSQLINDLLDVSRVISGKLQLNIGPVQPLSIVELAIDAVKPAADSKGILIEKNFHQGIGELPGDPDRIQQIIWNLLSNSIKFTPAGGTVSIVVERIGNYVQFKISDTGQGMSPEFLPYVFDRFRQADGTASRMHGGLGLGLAIVRHLAELHGGTVQAESEGEGLGATFTVRLPIQPAAASFTDPRTTRTSWV